QGLPKLEPRAPIWVGKIGSFKARPLPRAEPPASIVIDQVVLCMLQSIEYRRVSEVRGLDLSSLGFREFSEKVANHDVIRVIHPA
ncbi:MAG TPA: hypothetical protein VI756_25130, partial [Blastocatellia bacterium]